MVPGRITFKETAVYPAAVGRDLRFFALKKKKKKGKKKKLFELENQHNRGRSCEESMRGKR
jgi:hypothetical protein